MTTQPQGADTLLLQTSSHPPQSPPTAVMQAYTGLMKVGPGLVPL
jgi:hypothetical protein